MKPSLMHLSSPSTGTTSYAKLLSKTSGSTYVVGKAVSNVRVSVIVLVASIRRFERRGSCDSINTNVAGKDFVEHGSAFASFDVEYHF